MARTNKRQLSAKPKSPFQHAVENTSEISSAYCKGLQALKKSETGKVIASEPIKIDGSVDIDSAVKKLYPEDNRWDYAIGYDGKVCYIEVHPAYTSEVATIEAKFSWLKAWLKNKAPQLWALPKASVSFVWVHTKGGYILPQSRQAKTLASLGIKVVPVHKLT
ncbi:hypothetical protein [uncultured Bacteroides sp.]|uniref:hypothetical protein n=1 Tax=uncultured Bacteroides sp. TaxID=162156 RepID=UPI0025F9DBFB|nr:hypothetical protein [uncultured Bacteroides sp.]